MIGNQHVDKQSGVILQFDFQEKKIYLKFPAKVLGEIMRLPAIHSYDKVVKLIDAIVKSSASLLETPTLRNAFAQRTQAMTEYAMLAILKGTWGKKIDDWQGEFNVVFPFDGR